MDEFTSRPTLPVFRPRTLDHMFRWTPGTALRFARSGLLPYLRRRGRVRFDGAYTLVLFNHYRGYSDDERFEQTFSEEDLLEMAVNEMARTARRQSGRTTTSKGDEEGDSEE